MYHKHVIPLEPRPKQYNSISFTNINHYYIIIYLNAQPSNA